MEGPPHYHPLHWPVPEIQSTPRPRGTHYPGLQERIDRLLLCLSSRTPALEGEPPPLPANPGLPSRSPFLHPTRSGKSPDH